MLCFLLEAVIVALVHVLLAVLLCAIWPSSTAAAIASLILRPAATIDPNPAAPSVSEEPPRDVRVGDCVVPRGELCTVIAIDRSVVPIGVTVQNQKTGMVAHTELAFLSLPADCTATPPPTLPPPRLPLLRLLMLPLYAVECFGHLLDSDHEDDINFEPVQTELNVLQAGTTSAAAAAARRAGITQESLNAAVGCYQAPKDGPRKGWVPINPPPNFTQHELESEEGCTNLHKRKIRWIAHIFDDGWHIGRIQDDKAPKGHKHAGQYDVRYPCDGSKYWTVLHPAQYGPDQSWVYVEAPPAPQRAPAKGSKARRR